MKRGCLIIDRGSREKEAIDELDMICEKVQERLGCAFTDYCFLEVIPPFIKDGIEKSIEKKIEELVIVPYFLYPGKKIKATVNDVMKYQKVTSKKLKITKPMTMHKTLIDLVDNRIISSLQKNQSRLSSKQVDVLIIGHGSKDPNAKLSIQYVVDGLQNKYRNVSHCYLEIEKPNISEGIKMCEKNNPSVLVVVFYFLHQGAHVKRDIFEDLNPAMEESKIENFIITEHLGADEKMIDLIVDRVNEV